MSHQTQHKELFLLNNDFHQNIGYVDTLPPSSKETEPYIKVYQGWPERSSLSKPEVSIHYRIPEVRARWRYFNVRDSSLKKVSLLAYDQKES